MPGLRAWRNPQNEFVVARTHYTADPRRRGDWRKREAPAYGGLRSWRWRKEQEIDWHAQAGRKVFENWDDTVHLLNEGFVPPEHWPKWLLIDPGWTNPTAMNWVAVDVDSEPDEFGFLPVHVYREFYRPKYKSQELAMIAFESSKRISPEGHETMERIEEIIMDPSAKQEHQSAMSSTPDHVDDHAATVFDEFRHKIEEMGWDAPVATGNNHKQTPIEELVARLGNYWVDHEGIPLYDENDNSRLPTEEELLDGAFLVVPTFFIHPGCTKTAHEMALYRWRDWASNEVAERRNDPENPVDKDDHAITNLIRLLNHLREFRGSLGELDPGFDLKRFDSRFEHVDVRDADQILEEQHSRIIARYRKKKAQLRQNR